MKWLRAQVPQSITLTCHLSRPSGPVHLDSPRAMKGHKQRQRARRGKLGQPHVPEDVTRVQLSHSLSLPLPLCVSVSVSCLKLSATLTTSKGATALQ